MPAALDQQHIDEQSDVEQRVDYHSVGQVEHAAREHEQTLQQRAHDKAVEVMADAE